jgi:hypothetical protein
MTWSVDLAARGRRTFQKRDPPYPPRAAPPSHLVSGRQLRPQLRSGVSFPRLAVRDTKPPQRNRHPFNGGVAYRLGSSITKTASPQKNPPQPPRPGPGAASTWRRRGQLKPWTGSSIRGNSWGGIVSVGAGGARGDAFPAATSASVSFKTQPLTFAQATKGSQVLSTASALEIRRGQARGAESPETSTRRAGGDLKGRLEEGGEGEGRKRAVTRAVAQSARHDPRVSRCCWHRALARHGSGTVD